jgi:hypothetical protein
VTLSEDYAKWLMQLKTDILLSRNNGRRIGREILERQQTQGWGAKVIGRLASDLKDAFPEMKGWSSSNLKYAK